MSDPMYPDGISGRDLCYMEGCVGKGNCYRCGEINYHLLGWYGAVARWAKEWGVTEDEAEERITRHQMQQDVVAGLLEPEEVP